MIRKTSIECSSQPLREFIDVSCFVVINYTTDLFLGYTDLENQLNILKNIEKWYDPVENISCVKIIIIFIIKIIFQNLLTFCEIFYYNKNDKKCK